MIKYAKIMDLERGICSVGIGNDTEFYKSLGMTPMDVKEVKGLWYLSSMAPTPPDTVTVRIFSKYKLCDTTSQIPFTLADGTQTTVWEAFKSFITAAGKKDLWDNIIEVAEDNKHFQEAIPIAIENFGAELVEQVLAASVERTETRVVEGE